MVGTADGSVSKLEDEAAVRTADGLVAKREDEAARKLEGSSVGKEQKIPDSEGWKDIDTSDSISIAET